MQKVMTSARLPFRESFRQLGTCLLLLSQLLPLSAEAAVAPHAAGNGNQTSANPGNLNLASTARTIAATKSGQLQIGGQAGRNGIVRGGSSIPISPGQLITPAMNAALMQAIGGAQHMVINNAGAAIGGTAILNSGWQNLASLVVPSRVTVDFIGYNKANPLNVSGAANIFGSVYALQTSPGQAAVLNFNSLNIASGGVLSSLMPVNQVLPGVFASKDLNLNVAGAFNNSGTVSAPGTLNLNVGGTLSNISNAGATPATLSAQNINILSGNGNIVNSGVIAAINTLNLNTVNSAVNLNITNNGGLLQALGTYNHATGIAQSGVLNIRADDAGIEDANVLVSGGVLRAGQEINVYGRNMNIFADQIDGRINVKGSAAHLAVTDGTLKLGDQTLSGDPTYSSQFGDIIIDGTFITTAANANLAIVAGRNVFDTTSGLSFGLSSTNGGSITIAAGVNNISSNLVNDTSTILTFSTDPNSVTGGGSIIFSGQLQNGINTSNPGGIGGNVTLIALQGFSPTAGRIDLQSGGINTTGNTGNGDVLVVASAGLGAVAIQNLGPITATGAAATGNVSINSATLVSNGILVINGAVITALGTFTPAVLRGGAINLNSSIDAPGVVTVNSLGPITVGNIGSTRTPSLVNVFSTLGSISLGSIASSGAITIGNNTATGITLNGNITNLAGSGAISITTNTGGINGGTNSVTANGVISIVAGSGDVSIGAVDNSSSIASNLQVSATTGVTRVGAMTSNGGAIGAGNVSTGRGIVLTGNINNQSGGSGGDVSLRTLTGGIAASGVNITSDGNITISANDSANSGNISLGVVNNLSGTSKDVGIGAQSGAVSLAGVSASRNAFIGDSSGGTGLTITGNISAGGQVNLRTNSGGINGGTNAVTAGDTITIVASSGDLKIGTVDNTSSTSAADIGIGASTGITTVGAITSKGGAINVGDPFGGRGVVINGNIDNRNSGTSGDVSVRTLTGGIAAAGVLSDGNVTVFASGNANSGNVSVGLANNITGTGKNMSISSRSGTVSSGGAISSGDIFVGDIFNGTGITLTGNVFSSAGQVDIRTNSGGINGASSSVSAGKTITVVATSGNVSVGALDNTASTTSASVSVVASSGITSVGAITSSGGAVTVGNFSNGSGIVLNGNIDNRKSGAGGDVNVRTETGGIAGGGMTITSDGNVNVSAGGSANSGSVSIGLVNNSSGSSGNVFVTSHTGTVVSGGVISSSNITIGDAGSGLGTTLTGSVYSSKGQVNIRTNSGGVNGGVNSVTAGDVVNILASSGDLTIGAVDNTASTTGAGITVFATSGITTVGAITSSGGSIFLGSPFSGRGIVLTGNIDNRKGGSGGDVALRTLTGGIAGAGRSITSDGTVSVAAGDATNSGAVSIGLITNISGSGNSVFIDSNSGTVSSGGVISSADVGIGNPLNCKGITLTGNIIAGDSSGSGVTILTQTGGISGAGSSISSSGTVNLVALDPVNSGAVTIGQITGSGVGINSVSGTIFSGGIVSNGAVMIGNAMGAKGISLTGNIIGLGSSSPVTILTLTGGIAGASCNISTSGNVSLVAADSINSGAVSIGQVSNTSAVVGSGTVFIDSVSGTMSAAGVFALESITIGSANSGTGITLTGNVTNAGGNNAIVQIITATGGINASSNIVASGDLNIFANGPVQVGGLAASTGGAVLIGGASLFGTDAIAVNDSSAAISATFLASGGGNIRLLGDLSAPAITLQVGSNGNIVQSSGKSINSSGLLTLALSGGGSASANLATAVASLADFADGTQSVTINNSGALSLGAIQGLAQTLSITASGAITASTTFGVAQLNLTGTSITANSAIGASSTASIHATGGAGAGAITGTGSFAAPVLSLISDNDSIGSSSSALSTQTNSLTASAARVVNISNTGALASLSSTGSSSFTLVNNNAINIGAGGLVSSGAVSLSTTANNGSIFVNNGNLSSGGALSLVTAGSGSVNIGNGVVVSTAGNNVVIRAGALDLDGSLNAGAGTVTIQPNTTTASIGINGGAGSFQASGTNLANIVASLVVFGSSAGTGTIEINTAGSSFSPLYNVSILGSTLVLGNSLTNNDVIAMGSNTLTVTTGGSITTGVITGAGNTVSLTGVQIDIDGAITLSGASSLNLHARGTAGGGAISGSGTLSSASITLAADNGFIGATSGSTPLSTAATTSLVANAANDIDIQNSGALSSVSSSSSTSFTLSNDNAINVGSSGLSSSGPVTLSATNGPVNIISGNVTSPSTVSISSNTITVGSTATLSGSSVTLSGLSVNGTIGFGSNMNLSNSGSIQATAGSITLGSAAGQDLVLSGSGSGRFTVPTNNIISFTATDNPTGNHPNLVLGPGNQTFFVGNGTAPGGTVSFTANGSVNSSVSILSGVVYNFPNDFTHVAINSGNFNGNPAQFNVHPGGGNPNSTLTLAAAFAGTIANSTGPIDLGNVSLKYAGPLAILSASDITSSGPMTLDLSSAGGTGGNLTLIAGFKFSPTTVGTVGPNSIDYTLIGTATGSINIPFVNLTTSGTTGGGSITAVANGLVSIGQIDTSSSAGAGGNITIIGNGVTLLSAINAFGSTSSGAVNISSSSSAGFVLGTHVKSGVLLGGGFTAGTPGGIIAVSNINAGSVALQTGQASGAITLFAGLPVAHNVSLIAGAGTITGLPQSPAVLAPTRDSSGNGGTLVLSASNLSASNLNIDVSGTGSGNGGSVSYLNNSSTALSVNSALLQVNVSGNNAGSATISSGGNLTFNPAAVITALITGTGPGNGKGADITLTAGSLGTGALLITGGLSADGGGSQGIGGSITLNSSSTVAFNIGSTAATNTNGIRGALSVAGVGTALDGTINISNKLGGIVDATQALLDVNVVKFDTSGAATGTLTIARAIGSASSDQITLTAGGKGTILPGANVLTANKVFLTSGSGAITANVNASEVSGNTGGVAAVSISNRRSGLLTVDASSAGGNLLIRNTGTNSGIQLAGGVISNNAATGTITLTATGTGTITDLNPVGSDSIQAVTINLNPGAGSAAIGSGTAQSGGVRIRASRLAANTSGLVNLNNLGFGSALLTITAARSASTFTLRSVNAVRVNPSMPNATGVLIDTSTGSGSITIQGTLGNRTTTDSVNLITTGGSITGPGILVSNNGGTVTLATVAGSIGTSTVAMRTNTPSLSIPGTTASLINVTNVFTGATTVATNLVATGVVTYRGSGATTFSDNIGGSSINLFTGGTTTFTANKTVTATNGAISVNASSGLLTVGANDIFQASSTGTTAKITLLERANVTGAGITIGSGAQLLTDANGTKSGTVGQISVVVGAAVPAKVLGTQPATNVSVDTSQATNPAVNTVYWGTVPNVLTTAPVNNLKIVGNTAIQFSAGNRAPITLGGGTQITADPPAASLVLAAPTLSTYKSPLNSGYASVSTVSTHTSQLPDSNSQAAANNARTNAPGFLPSDHAITFPQNAMLTGNVIVNSPGALNSSRHLSKYVESNSVQEKYIANGVCEVIYDPRANTIVETTAGKIEIAARSLVLVSATENGVAVFNIDDTHRDAVRITLGGHSISVSPGRQIFITTTGVSTFDLLNPIEAIGYRHISSFDLGKLVRVFSSDFSIPSAIAAIEPLRALLKSKSADSDKLKSHLMKTVAAIFQLNAGNERYQQVLHPRRTAFNSQY